MFHLITLQYGKDVDESSLDITAYQSAMVLSNKPPRVWTRDMTLAVVAWAEASDPGDCLRIDDCWALYHVSGAKRLVGETKTVYTPVVA